MIFPTIHLLIYTVHFAVKCNRFRYVICSYCSLMDSVENCNLYLFACIDHCLSYIDFWKQRNTLLICVNPVFYCNLSCRLVVYWIVGKNSAL